MWLTFCSGDQGQHAVHHAEAGAQNGNQRNLAAGQHVRFGHGDGRLNLYLFGGKVTGGLIAKKHGQPADELLEFFGAGVFVAKQAHFVLYQG